MQHEELHQWLKTTSAVLEDKNVEFLIVLGRPNSSDFTANLRCTSLDHLVHLLSLGIERGIHLLVESNLAKEKICEVIQEAMEEAIETFEKGRRVVIQSNVIRDPWDKQGG